MAGFEEEGKIIELDSEVRKLFSELTSRLAALEAEIYPVINSKNIYPGINFYYQVEKIYDSLKKTVEKIEKQYNNQYPKNFPGKLWRSIKDLVISLKSFITRKDSSKEPVRKLGKAIKKVNFELKQLHLGVREIGDVQRRLVQTLEKKGNEIFQNVILRRESSQTPITPIAENAEIQAKASQPGDQRSSSILQPSSSPVPPPPPPPPISPKGVGNNLQGSGGDASQPGDQRSSSILQPPSSPVTPPPPPPPPPPPLISSEEQRNQGPESGLKFSSSDLLKAAGKLKPVKPLNRESVQGALQSVLAKRREAINPEGPRNLLDSFKANVKKYEAGPKETKGSNEGHDEWQEKSNQGPDSRSNPGDRASWSSRARRNSTNGDPSKGM